MKKIRTMQHAIKRSITAQAAFATEYNAHPLAAVVCNNHLIIEGEFDKDGKDYIIILECQYKMAVAINKFADNNLLLNDSAAQYWINVYGFIMTRYAVIDFLKLDYNKPFTPLKDK